METNRSERKIRYHGAFTIHVARRGGDGGGGGADSDDEKEEEEDDVWSSDVRM